MSTETVTQKQLIQQWVEAFNNGDAETLKDFYHDDAVNHQMPNNAVHGKKEIGEMFRQEFLEAPEMHCIPVQIICEGNWAVLEWKDSKNFRGCGFFEIVDGKIKTQRGYWDKLSFLQLYNK